MSVVPDAVFQKFCVLYAHHFDLSQEETFEKLPDKLKQALMAIPYKILVKPLICHDRFQRDCSWEFLSRRYCLPKRTIRDLVGCCS